MAAPDIIMTATGARRCIACDEPTYHVLTILGTQIEVCDACAGRALRELVELRSRQRQEADYIRARTCTACGVMTFPCACCRLCNQPCPENDRCPHGGDERGVVHAACAMAESLAAGQA